MVGDGEGAGVVFPVSLFSVVVLPVEEVLCASTVKPDKLSLTDPPTKKIVPDNISAEKIRLIGKYRLLSKSKPPNINLLT